MHHEPPINPKRPRRRLNRRLKAAGATVVAILWVWVWLPRPQIYPPDSGWSRVVRDRNGCLLHIAAAADGRYRVWTPLAGVSPHWVQATLHKEDRWFRWHPGINPLALLRAIGGAVRRNTTGGASTITMQVARLRWHLETRSITGKLEQIGRALQLERHYSKDQILEAYFNLAPFGGNVEGAGAAAYLWCGRDAMHINQREAIALSVIPQSPSTRQPGHPHDAPHIAAAQGRLATMLEKHADLRVDPLAGQFTLTPPGPPPHEAPHLCRRLLQASAAREIVSTLELAMQQQLERGISAHIQRTRDEGIVNACAMLVHAPSREVLAYVGSADYADREICGMVDGLRARRSPGSTLKPFVYGLALDQGLIHSRSLLCDGPMGFNDYNPENFEGEFLGPIHANDALVRSRNIPAVALANRLEAGSLYRFLQDSGVNLSKPAGYYGLALALGGCGISPVQLAALYCGLADDGQARPMVFRRSRAQEVAAEPPNTRPLISAAARFLILEMLRGGSDLGPEFGFARTDPGVAWKTGTSHGFRDAWAVGVRGDYVLLVWLGNFSGRGNNALVARHCAAPLLFDLFSRLSLPDKSNSPPPGVRQVDLCAISGELPGPWCKQSATGWFIPGVSPIGLCQLHRSILVDGNTGKRVASDDGRPGLLHEVHEFWPPDQLELFRKAGLPRRVPPEPETDTDTLLGLDPGHAPVITAPLHGRTYQLDDNSADSGIQLQARATPGVSRLYWFDGEAFLGSCAPADSLSWQARPGDHRLRVLDDHGRSRDTIIRVRRGE
ncbi:MAG: penicillin-binding protein 1C [Verrucomicrobiota bacterium]